MKVTKRQKQVAQKIAFLKAGKPVKPLSAYNTFFQQEMKKYDIADMKGTERLRVIAARWKTLDSTTRCIYEEDARLRRAQYEIDLALWESRQGCQGQQRRVWCQQYQQHYQGQLVYDHKPSPVMSSVNVYAFPMITNMPSKMSLKTSFETPTKTTSATDLVCAQDLEPLNAGVAKSSRETDFYKRSSKDYNQSSPEDVSSISTAVLHSSPAPDQAQSRINSTLCNTEGSTEKDFVEFLTDVFGSED